MTTITAEHLNEAAKLLGKKLLDSVPEGRQALLLSDQSYLYRLALGSVNRDVNTKWVAKLKNEMSHLIMARERTCISVCIDVRNVMRVVEEQSGTNDFHAIILDGQHRVSAMKELLQSHPTSKFEFWLQVYIVSSEIEMHQLIEDLDRKLPISAKDKKTIEDRRGFSEALLELIPKTHHHRRCVTGTLNHKVLRNPEIVEALKDMTKDQLMLRMRMVADMYKGIYQKSPPKTNSVMAKVVEDTKLYQMIEWETAEWIYKTLQVPTPDVEVEVEN